MTTENHSSQGGNGLLTINFSMTVHRILYCCAVLQCLLLHCMRIMNSYHCTIINMAILNQLRGKFNKKVTGRWIGELLCPSKSQHNTLTKQSPVCDHSGGSHGALIKKLIHLTACTTDQRPHPISSTQLHKMLNSQLFKHSSLSTFSILPLSEALSASALQTAIKQC